MTPKQKEKAAIKASLDLLRSHSHFSLFGPRGPCHVVGKAARFQNEDLFGEFDIAQFFGSLLFLIQVKHYHSGNISKAKRTIETNFAKAFYVTDPPLLLEVWGWMPEKMTMIRWAYDWETFQWKESWI